MASRGKALAALVRGEDSSRGARRQRVPSGFRPEAVARVLTPIAKDSDSSVIESQFHRLKKQFQGAHAALRARLGRTPKKNDYSESERDTYNKVKALKQTLWPGCFKKRERSPAEPPGVRPLDYSSAGPLPALPTPPKAAQSLLPALATAESAANRKRRKLEQPPALHMEVACCDTDHEGEWKGEWEECEVVADHGEKCDVRIVVDGEVCRNVPRRFVRCGFAPDSNIRMEVASCDADHEGEWKGEWEECVVVAEHGETCDVLIIEDGELCRSVPLRLVRPLAAATRQSVPNPNPDPYPNLNPSPPCAHTCALVPVRRLSPLRTASPASPHPHPHTRTRTRAPHPAPPPAPAPAPPPQP